jgi:hypothetical protein
MIEATPARDTTFLLLGERKLLFSEARQELFELNDIAAFIWCSLEEGLPLEAIAAALAERGVGRSDAERFVASILSDWARTGLVSVARPTAGSAASDGARSVALSLPNCGVVLRLGSERIADLVLPAVGHLATGDAADLDPIELSERGDAIALSHGERLVEICKQSEIVASLKAYLTQKVLDRSAPNVVVHAACLVHDAKAVLMIGRPGAGKTTLTLALAHAGFGYAGDDIALLTPGGSVQGVPFAAAVKSGSWDLVSRFVPDFGALPVHWRADRKRVRYVVPPQVGAQTGRPVGWFLFLRRKAGERPALADIEPAEAMTRLIAHSYAQGGRLSTTGAHALAASLSGARICDFTYSDLDDAVEAIKAVCHGT